MFSYTHVVLDIDEVLRVSSGFVRARVSYESPDKSRTVVFSMTEAQARQLVADLQALIDRELSDDNVLRFPVAPTQSTP